MQRRIRAALLGDNAFGNAYPAPRERQVDTSALYGGLNLWELDYRLEPNQSPDCVNVYWKDGSLSSRGGQMYIYDAAEAEEDYGQFYACYDRPWQNYAIVHKGTTIYKVNPTTGEHTSIYSGELSRKSGGTFFVFGDSLYYMNGEEYIKINDRVEASDVEPYTPIVIVGRPPDGNGGQAFEDENRLSPKKTIQFTTNGSATEYLLPEGYKGMDPVAVKIKLNSPTTVPYFEVQNYSSRSAFPETGYEDIAYHDTSELAWYKWENGEYVTTTAPASDVRFTVDRTAGKITFVVAPPQAATQSPSNLDVTISKTDEDTLRSVLGCTCVTVYGSDTNLSVVCGGTPGQPNAYFWSGSTKLGLDPTYFPFDYYNYAGANAHEYIIGFGKQQSMLVIFKERSIGKSYSAIETVDGMDYLKMPYLVVNEVIGCDLEKSIRLVQNNLVFANTYGGVYVLLDTSSYGENAVKRISRNVNGEPDNMKGLLYDLRQVAATAVTSFDDQQRYWITANGHAYLWDYTISSFQKNEGKISWFYFENINTRAWFNTIDDNYYFMQNGSMVGFQEAFNDFGGAIPRKYTFATQIFGTYEYLKDVLKVIFSVRSDTDSAMTITYKTDYEVRQDKTPIRAYGWKFVPRDLTHRGLRPLPFAGTAIRKPRCFHVRHFQMILENNDLNTDMSVVSAQIIYRYSKEDR